MVAYEGNVLYGGLNTSEMSVGEREIEERKKEPVLWARDGRYKREEGRGHSTERERKVREREGQRRRAGEC